MAQYRHFGIIIAFAVLLSACGFVRDDPLVARYRIVAVDLEEDTSLCWTFGDHDCDTLVGPRLIAAGYDDRYVVAVIHPEKEKSLTQYFYIVRDKRRENSDDGDFHLTIKGPFLRNQFQSEKRRLHLPGFTWTSEDLK